MILTKKQEEGLRIAVERYKNNSSEIEAREKIQNRHNRDLMRFIQILDAAIGDHN